MFILDTNVLIPALIKDTPESEWLRKQLEKEDMIFCPIVIAEYLVKASKKETRLIKKLVDFYGIVNIDYAVASISAKYRQNSGKTKKVLLFDCLVAACAKKTRSKLFTYNIKDYPMKNLTVLPPC